jgi:hypothetical protein
MSNLSNSNPSTPRRSGNTQTQEILLILERKKKGITTNTTLTNTCISNKNKDISPNNKNKEAKLHMKLDIPPKSSSRLPPLNLSFLTEISPSSSTTKSNTSSPCSPSTSTYYDITDDPSDTTHVILDDHFKDHYNKSKNQFYQHQQDFHFHQNSSDFSDFVTTNSTSHNKTDNKMNSKMDNTNNNTNNNNNNNELLISTTASVYNNDKNNNSNNHHLVMTPRHRERTRSLVGQYIV